MKKNHKLSVGIVGLWHLGCVYAASFASFGFNVVGFDPDKKIISNLQKGIPPIHEPKLTETIKKNLNKRLFFSSEKSVMNKSFPAGIKNSDYIFISYDLIVDNNDLVKMDVIYKTFKILGNFVSDSTVIVISSVVPIGTSRILVNLLKKKGIKNPKIIYFPENLRLGQAFTSFLTPDRIILGSDNKEALNQFKKDFHFFNCPVITMSLESAEMVKHALNSYLATCISFSSELSDLSEITGANMLDVVKALKTDRRVSKYAPINPGLGFTGGTLARDIQILRKIAKNKNYKPRLLNAVYSVNQDRVSILMRKITLLFPSLQGKKIGILGLTYKPNTNTLRRSQSLELAILLKQNNCLIKAFDPLIKNKITGYPFIKVSRNLKNLFKDLDLLILMTQWPEFQKIDLQKLSMLMKTKIVIDTKNFLESSIYKEAGFTYIGMGV